VGSPPAAIDLTVLAPPTSERTDTITLPERITLPAAYRLILLDGHMTLVREADAEALSPAPTSMRMVTGEISRGELAYQPVLLPQELAAEVAANRESAARMDNALESVMARSRELSEQAKAAQAQAERLSVLLAGAEARIRGLEPAPRKQPAASQSVDDTR
jgi:hypothetical protein